MLSHEYIDPFMPEKRDALCIYHDNTLPEVDPDTQSHIYYTNKKVVMILLL